MLEYKCDICGKIVAEAEHQGCGVHKSIAGAWDISINFDRRCEGEYCNGGNHMLVCDDCLERIKKLPWEEFTKIDDAVTSTLMVKAMAVTGHFDNVNPMMGLPSPVGFPPEPDEKYRLKNMLSVFVDAIKPEALDKANKVIEKLKNLGAAAYAKLFDKLDDYIDKNAKKLLEEKKDDNDTGDDPENG